MEGKRHRILVVEDHEGLARVLATVFERTGFCETVTAADGIDAMVLARSEVPDLILLDLRLPGIDGLEVCRRLRAAPATHAIPILMYTAIDDRETVLAGLQAGASDYVIKGSINNRELVARALRLIDSARRAEEFGGTTSTARRSFPAAVKQGNNGSKKKSTRSMPGAPRKFFSRADLALRISGLSELKAMPFCVKELMALSSNPNADIREVVTVIERDPAIAAQVLRLSNAAIYGVGQRIATLDRAVSIIGMRSIRELAMGLAVIEAFKDDNGQFGRQQVLISEHSFGTAVIARLIAAKSGKADPDKVFLGGLLHDVGKSMLFQYCGKEYSEVVAYAESTSTPLDEAEKRMLGMGHWEVAGLVLGKWMTPLEISLPPALHHRPWEIIKRRAADQSPAIACIAVADRIAQACRFGHGGEERLFEPERDMVDALDIVGVSVEAMYYEARSQYRQLLTNMAMYSEPGALKKIAEARTESAHQGVSVIIVDNKPLALNPVQFFLVHCGAKVGYARTADLEKLPRGEHDLLILRARTESVLQTMWEAVRESRYAPPACKAIALINGEVDASVLPPGSGIESLALPCRLEELARMIPAAAHAGAECK